MVANVIHNRNKIDSDGINGNNIILEIKTMILEIKTMIMRERY